MSDTDFIRARLDAMIDLFLPLAVLATRMPKDQFEARVAPFLRRQHAVMRVRILEGQRQPGVHKANTQVFALHAPGLHCIAMGKVRQPCKWGCKVNIDATQENSLVLGSSSFAGRPFDDLALCAPIAADPHLAEGPGRQTHTAAVDQGCLEVDADYPTATIRTEGALTHQSRRWLKRRQAAEPLIGHRQERAPHAQVLAQRRGR